MVHELVVGSRVVGSKKFSPTKGRALKEADLAKIREGEEQDTLPEVNADFEDKYGSDPAMLKADLQLGNYVMFTMALFYFAGYFVLIRYLGPENSYSAVFGGIACALVSLLVELWLWSIRSETAEAKLSRALSPTTTTPTPRRRVVSPPSERYATTPLGTRTRNTSPK